jgi:hypothetical protein
LSEKRRPRLWSQEDHVLRLSGCVKEDVESVDTRHRRRNDQGDRREQSIEDWTRAFRG